MCNSRCWLQAVALFWQGLVSLTTFSNQCHNNWMLMLCAWRHQVNYRGGMMNSQVLTPNLSTSRSVIPECHSNGLFIPLTMFSPSQWYCSLSGNAIVFRPSLCAGESYVMHPPSEVLSSFLTCSNNINFNKYLWKLAVSRWYGRHKLAIKFL